MGLFGFLLLLVYDIASLKQYKNRFRLAHAGYAVQVFALALAVCAGGELELPGFVVHMGWPVTVLGSCWLIYCLFLYPPIRKTYKEQKKPVLTITGPYALTRHPGFFGYLSLVFGLVVVSRSNLLWKSGLYWNLANFIYILVQDKIIFPSLFPGYREYSGETPFLIPNSKSIRRFIKTIRMP